MIEVKGSGSQQVLPREALAFVEELHRHFESRRRELLARRDQRYQALAGGAQFEFLKETAQEIGRAHV